MLNKIAGMEAATVTSAPQQFSRYRSVRKAATHAPGKPPIPAVPEVPLPTAGPQDQGQISRAPSRYHRKNVAPLPREAPVPVPVPQRSETVPGRYRARPTTSRPQPIPSAKAQPEAPLETSTPPRKEDTPLQAQRRPVEYTRTPVGSSTNQRTTRYRSRAQSTPNDRTTSPDLSYNAAREEARAILDGEYDRLQRLKQQQEKLARDRRQQVAAKPASPKVEQVSEVPAVETEQAKSLPHRVRKWTIGGSSDGSPPVTAPSTPSSTQASQTIQSTLSRKVSKIVRRPRPEDVIDESPPVPVQPSVESTDQPVQKSRERRPTITRHAPKIRNYEPKAGDGPPKTAIAAPQTTTDAPVSAVNAGDRRVDVRFEGSRISLPVTPSTTVRELLNSASIVMSQPIDPRKSVLVETYHPLGLERPLRRYERVRDVMNSWDSDTQNHLTIMPESECDARGLDQKDAPRNPPSHTLLNFHHSQKPGKWEKHWMILKEDGQVTASKTENDFNATNAFHLSDFDVYMLTKRELRKLKPPKKICFAIKSQQRSIMFESTENFVHFFSTNDKSVADEWYNAAQAWRSWYLVNILDQGGASKPPPTSAAPMAFLPSPQRPSTSHSRDSVPYQLGTFQPLLEFSVDDFRYGEEEERSKPMATAGAPQRSKTLVGHARNTSTPEGKTAVMQRAATGKFRNQSVSKAPRVAAEEFKDVRTGPILGSTDDGFTGKGLLARAFSVRKAQAEENAAIFDNTDNAFTGKGLLARQLSTKKHVHENQVIAENTADAFTGGGLLARKMSTKKFVNENSVVPENTNDAFTGKGLVARTMTKKRSQVAKPGQPLVELAASSEFVDRSLLRNVEAYEMAQGQHLPVIDRSKNVEVVMKTGEV